MVRRSEAPLRFAHSSGALALDQDARQRLEGKLKPGGKPLTIVQATAAIDGAAAEPAALWAAEAAAVAGARSVVVANAVTSDRLKRIGVEFHGLPLDGRGPVAPGRSAARLQRLLIDLQADIVHARTEDLARIALQAVHGRPSAAASAQVVVSCGADAPFIKAARDGGALIQGAAIAAGSRHVRDVISAEAPEKRAVSAVIPSGVDTAAFSPQSISSERLARLARAWGMLEEPAPTVLVSAAIEPLRGQQVLARALGLIARDDPGLADMVAIVAGTTDRKGAFARQLAGLARRQGASGRIFLSPPLEDLPAAMMLADVIVSLPQEPLGQDPVAAAAQLLGKPVLAARHGATGEMVLDGVTGRVAEHDDPDAVAAALRALLQMPSEERAVFSDKARARAMRLFSAEAAAEATVGLYGALAASTGR